MVRDREGLKLSLSETIKCQYASTAKVCDLDDKGLLPTDCLADITINELDKIGMSKSWGTNNLPADGKRLLQSSTGYRMTFKSGFQTLVNRSYLGQILGSLIRGHRHHS